MTLTARMVRLAELTAQDPRAAARVLLSLNVPLPARTLGLLLVSVVSAILTSIQIGIQPDPVDPLIGAMTASPIRAAVLQWLALALSVAMIHWVGRAFGGRGSPADALLLVVWLQVLLLAIQGLQLAADLVSPALAAIIGLLSLGVFLWLLTSFIAELHGFGSRGLVFIGVVLSALALGVVIASALILVLGPEVFLPHV